MKFFFKQIKKQAGAVALVLVVMITTLTLVSVIVIALINISDLVANYHVSESARTQANLDSCLNEALYRIASSSAAAGSFTLTVSTTDCAFNIGVAQAGIKTVNIWATTTGDLGAWARGVSVDVNVSNSPIMIDSYKDILN